MTPDDLVVATEAYDYPLTLDHLLHTALTVAPAREIVHGTRGRYDYRELRRRIGCLAAGLASLGVKPGATVAVMDWDSPRYLECFFAIPAMGAVLHTINVRLSPDQILYTVNHAEDDVILVHEDFIPLVEQIRERFDRMPKLVLVRDDDGAPLPEHGLDFATDYRSLLDRGGDGYEFPALDERTRATTFYTTGTTGDPKGVWYTHRQLVLHTLGALAAVASGGGHARLHRDDVYMPISPMFHVHAWGMPFVATLLGVKQVYPGRYDPETLLRLIEREGVTFSHCVPTIMHMLLGSPVADEIDLSGWKVVVGGSAMSAGLARAAMDRGIDVFGGYGMSETGPVLTLAQLERPALSLPDDAQIDLRCKAGRPIPLVDLRVVDESMRPGPAGRSEHRRGRGARAVDDERLPEEPRRVGGAVARRIPPHRRHRLRRRRRLPAGHRPAEGRDQVGRGVDLLHRAGGHRLAMRGRGRSRRHRCVRCAMGRTPAGARGGRGPRASARGGRPFGPRFGRRRTQDGSTAGRCRTASCWSMGWRRPAWGRSTRRGCGRGTRTAEELPAGTTASPACTLGRNAPAARPAPPSQAPVAQLDRVPGFEPGCRGFESLRARQFMMLKH